MTLTQISDGTKHAIDTLSGVAIISTIIGWLPFVIAIPGAVWYCIQIYDWYKRKRDKK